MFAVISDIVVIFEVLWKHKKRGKIYFAGFGKQ